MILVAGAGALGSSIAVALAQAGFEVTLADPAALGDNASGVAAGMLAPAFESVLDPVSADHFGLFSVARDLWPAFAERLGGRDIGLTRSGALWVDEANSARDVLATIEARLTMRGAVFERRPEGLFTPEDWRLEPALALSALHDAAREAGVVHIEAGLKSFENGHARLTDGRTIFAEKLVLASGGNLADLAPESAFLMPILGQILRFPRTMLAQSCIVMRNSGGYAVNSISGLMVGATMEPGRVADPGAARALRKVAAKLFPRLSDEEPTILRGIRAATPDGLPLVGPSSRDGVFLAEGARRNGWLLAPLVAEMTAAYLAGEYPGPYAKAMDARRFS